MSGVSYCAPSFMSLVGTLSGPAAFCSLSPWSSLRIPRSVTVIGLMDFMDNQFQKQLRLNVQEKVYLFLFKLHLCWGN